MFGRRFLITCALLVFAGNLVGCAKQVSQDGNGGLPADGVLGDPSFEIVIGREIAARGLIIVGSNAYVVARRDDKGFDVIKVSLSGEDTRVLIEAIDQEIAVSRDGKHIAFATFSEWGEVCQVKLLDLETGGIVRLADTVGSVRGIDFAPNGKSLVFASLEGLILVDMDGTSHELLVEGRAGGENTVLPFIPKWSPNGTRIAYSVTYYEGSGPISVVEVSGGAVLNVTRGNDWDLHWSPDGMSILYTNEEYDSDHSEVWLVDLSKEEPEAQALIDAKGIYRGLGWSPDGHGSLIQYSPPQREPGDAGKSLLTYDLVTGELRDVPAASRIKSLTATWAADGFIYYATEDGLIQRVLPGGQETGEL